MAEYGTDALVTPSRGKASACIDAIDAYEKRYQDWMERGKQVVRRYRDERTDKDMQRGFNILYSNVEVLRPTLFARAPKAEVVRRFTDRDPIGRIACEISERATNVEIERGKLGTTLKQAVDDRLLPGRGTIWISYDGKIDAATGNRTEEAVKPVFVHWQDFGHNVCRDWAEVTKAWRKVYFDKDAFKAKFPAVPIERISFTDAPQNTKGNQETQVDATQACVYEVWDMGDHRVKWVCKSYTEEYADEYDVPVDLQDFFPCPQPIYSTTTTDSLIPVPDFCQYQDQAYELDKITIGINRLTDGLKLAGVYDSSISGLDKVIESGSKNVLVPVANYGDLAAKGGLAKAVEWLPLGDVREALVAAYASRAQTIQAIYEITGISDILRGASNPNETLGAQNLKAQFGSTRIRSKQDETADFARDAVRIMAEIICEMYDPVTLWEMTNAESFCLNDQGQPDPQLFARAVALLRNDRLRTFRVDIETDSTLALDENMQKQSRVEFVGAVGSFISPFMQNPPPPEMLPLIGETLSFLARGFKAGRTMEGVIEKTMSALQAKAQQAAANPQPPPPDPRMEKIKQDGELGKANIMLKAKNDEAEQQRLARKDAAELSLTAQKQQGEQELARADHSLAVDDQQFNHAIAAAELRTGVVAMLQRQNSKPVQ